MATYYSGKRNIITLVWEIENAKHLTSEHEQMVISSPKFRIRTLKSRIFVLKLTPRIEVQRMKFVSLVLNLLEHGFGYPVDIHWSFLGIDGTPLIDGTLHNHYPMNFGSIEMYSLPSYEEVFVRRRSEFIKHNTFTVRLHIWKTEGNLDTEEFISLRSRLETMEDSILLKIPRFESMGMNEHRTYPVQFEISDNFVWRFFLTGTSLQDSFATIQVLSVLAPIDWNVTFTVSLLDSQQNVVWTVTERPRGVPREPWSLLVMSRRTLLQKSHKFLKNTILTLVCQVSVIQNVYSIRRSCFNIPNLRIDTLDVPIFLDSSTQTLDQRADSPSTSLQGRVSVASNESSSVLNFGRSTPDNSDEHTVVNLPEKDSLSVLVDDLLSLYTTPTLSDFELRSGGISFPVHKNILSARSSVFRTKFSSNAEECGPNFMDVTDLDHETVNRMLTFLYSGKMVHEDLDSALKLCYAACDYKVQSLQRDCCSFFKSNMSRKKVGDLLLLADKHQIEDLKNYLHLYILDHLPETVSTSEWATFSRDNAELVSQTMREVCQIKSNIKGIRKIMQANEQSRG